MSQDYVVYIDSDLEGLVPTFLANRKADIEKMVAALEQWDFQALRDLGHQIKGSGGGYGFDMVSQYGRLIQETAEAENGEECQGWVYGLAEYQENVQVVYQ